ncbi:MAG TPA: pyridoxamine 5-phosphate oxidase [Nitrospira sp.]|jgi:predicted pyridoxine 5'-phosphate oxidase superfamily flavin-nucleotide-binding protein|nr:pyridoxamine 5-phosphate oxidase [Nitrospira sp.]
MTGPGSPGEQRAQARFGTSVRAAAFYEHQVLAYLNRPMREFIARMEMVYIATADARGNCDCSFRAGAPGFVQVFDDRTLAYPEYRGNGVLASVGNMLENPRIGMVFLDYFQTTVGLHVNGSARVLDPQDMAAVPQLTLDPHDAGPTPKAWILIQVEEAYIHCSKHVPLLARREKHIVWGTDDERLKGGNFFKSTP